MTASAYSIVRVDLNAIQKLLEDVDAANDADAACELLARVEWLKSVVLKAQWMDDTKTFDRLSRQTQYVSLQLALAGKPPCKKLKI